MRILKASLKSAYWQAIEQIERTRRHSNTARTGMGRAAKWGQSIGRPRGKESIDIFLSKPKNKAIVTALAKKQSLREVARQTGVSISTIRKVKARLSDD